MMHTDKQTPGSAIDEELVTAARSANRDAFDELTRRHYAMVYAVALARLKDRDRAEDLAQEVFLHAWLLLDRLTDARLFSHWLSRIARNLAIDWQRRGAAGQRLLPMIAMDETVLQVPDSNTQDPRDAAATAERIAALHRVLELMDPKQREVVLLHYMAGLTHREIGRQMGVNQSTVSRLLDRTLTSMRDHAEAVLQEMARNLGPRPAAQQRTVALGAVVLGLSAAHKASLAGAAAATVRLGAGTSRAKLVGVPASALSRASILSAAKTGGVMMASSKGIVAVCAAAVIGAALYYHAHPTTATKRADVYTTAANDTRPAMLKWAPPVGRRVVVHVEEKSATKMDLPPSLQQMKSFEDFGGSEAQDYALTAREVGADGSRTVEVETLASNFTMNSPALAGVMQTALSKPGAPRALATPNTTTSGTMPYMQQFIGRKLAAHVNSSGVVQSIDGIKEANETVRTQVEQASKLMRGFSADSLFLERFKKVIAPASLPSAEMKIGDTWKSEEKMQVPMVGEVTITSTNRFVGWRMLDGHKVAEVQIDSNQSAPPVAINKIMTMKYDKYSTSGTFYFDPELGQVTQSVANTDVQLSMEMPKVPGKLPNGIQIKVTSHRNISQKIVQDSGTPQIAMQ